MSTSYSSRAGSVADRVIHHLRTLAPRAELTSGALAEALGIDPAGLATSLAPAVEHRAIFRRTKGGHAKSPAFWSLHDHSRDSTPPTPTPVATPQPGATFRCGLFSDGEFVLSANGQTLTLDRAQTRQLANFFDRIVTEPAA